MLGGPHGGGGVGVDDLPGDQPVEEHPQAGQVLLNGRGGVFVRQLGLR